MKIIVEPDKFKGSLSAKDVTKAAIKGLKEALPEVEIDSIPMADGGEGTVEFQKHGILAAVPICTRPMTGAEADKEAAKLVTAATRRALTVFLAGQRSGHD